MKNVILCLTLACVFFSCAASPKIRETSPPEVWVIQETPAGAPVQEMPPQAASGPELASGTEVNSRPEKPATLPARETIPPAAPPVRETIPPAVVSGPEVNFGPELAPGPELASGKIPERPARSPVPQHIMGKGLVPSKDMSAFLLSVNPRVERGFVENLAIFYTEEAFIEGVNHDAAFAQMCLETGFLKYGGLVTPEMNNFCGLGAIGPGQNGESFPNPRTGVRAHVQHLKAYATDAPLKQTLVDPRYHFVRRGSSPSIKGLSGTWAVDRNYAEKINDILERLYRFSFER